MEVSYILKRSKKRKRTISLQVTSNAEVVVSAPSFTAELEISRFVAEKQNWIKKVMQKQKEAASQKKEKEFTSGEFFYYLGEPYLLAVSDQQNLPEGIIFQNNRFYLNCPVDKAKRRNYFIAWYKDKAGEYIVRRLANLGYRLQLTPRSMKITSARTRWGSCSADNNLAFSYRLVMAPPPVISYVIIHELMHMKEKNHSSEFWKLMETALPGYKTLRTWLKENDSKLAL